MVGRRARHAVQDDAGVLELEHPTALLVDDPLDPAQHAGFLPAIVDHLAVERHSAIGVVDVEGRDDLLLAPDPNPLARSKVERLAWRLLQLALDERVPMAASDAQPPREPTPTGVLVLVEHAHRKRADRRQGTRVA